MGDKGLADCFSADVSAGGEAGDGCLTVEDDCASGRRVGDACTSPEDCLAAPREVGDAIETLAAGLVFGASGEGSRVVAARLLVEGVVAGPWGGTHHQ